MEQLSALSTVLCILLSPIGGADGLSISKEPGALNATVGGNMTLTCTFQNRGGTRAKVVWLWGSGEDVVLDSNHPFYRGRLNISNLDANRQGKATLMLSELEMRDSGLYKCYIEIDSEKRGTGGRTKLKVMRRNPGATEKRKESRCEPRTELTIYRAGIAVAGAGIVLLAGALVLCRHKATATETQMQKLGKRDRRPASNMNEDVQYAEITIKAPVHTEYACVQTQ